MHTHKQTAYIQTYIQTCIHADIHPCMHTYIHTYIHPSIHPYIHTYIQTYIHTYTHTHTSIHTSIHPYIYIYGRTNACTHRSRGAGSWRWRRGIGHTYIHPSIHLHIRTHAHTEAEVLEVGVSEEVSARGHEVATVGYGALGRIEGVLAARRAALTRWHRAHVRK